MTLLRNNEPVTIPIDRLDSLLDEEGRPTQRFLFFLELLAERVPIYGSGTPENQFEANKGRLYVDIDGLAGSRVYMKTTNGTATGWQTI